MLVTPTTREILPVFPGLRIVAMSMEGLEVVIPRVPSVSINMVNLQLVIMLEVLSTVGTAPVLFFEQGGYAGFHRRVVSSAVTPVHPIPIVRTPIAGDLGMKQAGALTLVGEPHLAIGSHRRGKHLTGVPSAPVPVMNPCCRGVGVAPVSPAAELHPYQIVQPTKGRLADPGVVVVGPTPDVGVKFLA